MNLVRHFLFSIVLLFFIGHICILLFGGPFHELPTRQLRGLGFGTPAIANDSVGKILLIVFDLVMAYLIIKIWLKKH
jgi:hypothetical protein